MDALFIVSIVYVFNESRVVHLLSHSTCHSTLDQVYLNSKQNRYQSGRGMNFYKIAVSEGSDSVIVVVYLRVCRYNMVDDFSIPVDVVISLYIIFVNDTISSSNVGLMVLVSNKKVNVHTV